MFGGARGSGWGAAVCALALLGSAPPRPAAALVIIPTYTVADCGGCSAVSSSPQAAQIEASFNTVIAQFEALYVNPVTVNVTLELQAGTFLGENVTQQSMISYGTFRSELAAESDNPVAQVAVANLPNTANAPVNNASTVQLSNPNARALVNDSTVGGSDASIIISNSFPIQFSRVDGQVAVNHYDFFATAEHELDEVLGLGSSLGPCGNAQCSDATDLPTVIRPQDLYRFAPNSTTRSFTFSSAAVAFASINGGASDLIQLNQDFEGDYGDFFSRDTPGTLQDSNAPCTAIVQNAFSCNGQVASVGRSSAETQLLAAMGWTPRFSTAASNTVWLVNCNAGTIARTGPVTTAPTPVTNPLGALLGTPAGKGTFTTLPVAGDTIEITGICTSDVTVTTSGLTITDDEGPDGSAADTNDADGLQGQLEINAAQQIVISGLLLGNFDSSFSFASPADLATLFVHDGATVMLLHTDVVRSPQYGLLARREAQVTLLDDRFLFNGFGSGAPGVGVLTNSKAVFGADDGSLSITVQGSGGDGVVAGVGSSVIFHAATLTANGGHQLSVESASSARLSGSGVTTNFSYVEQTRSGPVTIFCGTLHGTTCGTAIEATGSSMLRIEQGASVMALDSGSVVTAVAVHQGSALLIQGATIQALAGTPATVTATENSVIALAGGNMICAESTSMTCDTTVTGTAIVLDHVSTLIQVPPAQFGYAAAQDVLFGSATVQLQSTVDLGLGLVGGLPSLAWTTPSATGIVVAQNSSFRLQGGASITGNGGVSLGQASNGFFNVTAGGTNSVTGRVTCFFASIPSSHVTGNTAVTPNVVLATSFTAAASPQCLPF